MRHLDSVMAPVGTARPVQSALLSRDDVEVRFNV
jgi:hypothetical protein